MKRLAIIGTGIAGMVCGYRLHKKYDLTVYEKNDYIGGHTNTVFALEDGRVIPIDTGFMVYNEVTYPALTQLFAELDVKTQPAPMTFSVQHVPTGLEFCGSGLSGLFSQRANLFRPSFWKLLAEINRFNTQAPQILDDPKDQTLTLRDYAQQHAHTPEFLNQYLIPMSSAVWSTPPDAMLDFPAVTLIRFFKNHGFLGLNTQHAWRTVSAGTRMYRDKIVAPFKEKILVKRGVTQLKRTNGKAIVTDSSGISEEFDHVIIASHGDEALALLSDPTELEKRLLSPFKYQKNVATLHTDASVMPKTRAAWSSWNYRTERLANDTEAASTIYWMNSLQAVSKNIDYFVSINDPGSVNPNRVQKTLTYHHPIFSLEAIAAQAELQKLNENGVTYFCGSYFRYGFHEDALVSGLNVMKLLA